MKIVILCLHSFLFKQEEEEEEEGEEEDEDEEALTSVASGGTAPSARSRSSLSDLPPLEHRPTSSPTKAATAGRSIGLRLGGNSLDSGLLRDDGAIDRRLRKLEGKMGKMDSTLHEILAQLCRMANEQKRTAAP